MEEVMNKCKKKEIIDGKQKKESIKKEDKMVADEEKKNEMAIKKKMSLIKIGNLNQRIKKFNKWILMKRREKNRQ